MNWKPIIIKFEHDPWELAIECDALYECPKDSFGKRLGPLVPYAGKGPDGRNLVGDVYFNFARIEEHPGIVDRFAELLWGKVIAPETPVGTALAFMEATTIVGIPDGGRSLGQMVAFIRSKRFVYPAKVPRVKSEGATKEEYDLVFKRSELSPGETVIVCDDVHNNFQNTDDMLNEIGKTGAKVVGLCSALNRSPTVDSMYTPKAGSFAGISLPVVSVIRKPLVEWRQDDSEVTEDIKNGNIEPKVKDNWARLKATMMKARDCEHLGA